MAERWTRVYSFEEIERFASTYGQPHGINVQCYEDGRWTCGRLSSKQLAKYRAEIEKRIKEFGSVEVEPSQQL